MTHKVLIDYNRRGWAEEKESKIKEHYPVILHVGVDQNPSANSTDLELASFCEENNQIGSQGTFFVAVWSGVVSSIFYEVFNKMKMNPIFAGIKIYDKVPPFEEQKVVFVVPSPNAFQNYYLVVDRKRVVRIASYIEKKGYDKIQKKDSMSYLSLINVRKGCAFGITGRMPMIMFKLT